MTATAVWPTFEATLFRRELVAERTMSFCFTKPADWTYRAGQFVDITLLDPPETDAEGDTRGFSISSAPSEDVIMITTRLRDTAFKRVLQSAPIGTAVKIEGPFGDLRLHHSARPAVVLTGGIGITPFRSILLETIRAGGLPTPCSSSMPTDGPRTRPSSTSCAGWPSRTRTSRFVPDDVGTGALRTLGRGAGPHRCVYAGPLPRRHDRRHLLPDWPSRNGQGLRTMLVDGGVDEDDIRTEEFTGY